MIIMITIVVIINTTIIEIKIKAEGYQVDGRVRGILFEGGG